MNFKILTKQVLFFGISFILLEGCKIVKTGNQNWIDLLDENSIGGWRGYNNDSIPLGWFLNKDSLWFDEKIGSQEKVKRSRDIIFGGDEFEFFELLIDWKILKGGNSGIFYHLKEGYDSPTDVAPEYQIIDDVNYAELYDLVKYNKRFNVKNPELLQDWQLTGADYAMYPADEKNKILSPVGSWNRTRIVIKPGRTEYWLNGVKLLNFKPWSDKWYRNKNSGKMKDFSDYGKFTEGFIGLQNHGSSVWFKNIKIRKFK